jgi:two-component system response regulator GlrR
MTSIPADPKSPPALASTPTDILIVDDHETTARSLATVLQSAGYSTQIAHCGADALAKAAHSPPSVAMIDIHLPDLNGLILSKKLREQLGPGARLVVLSGDTSMETINSLQHVGATYFLSKPIHTAHLLEMVQGWLPRGG